MACKLSCENSFSDPGPGNCQGEFSATQSAPKWNVQSAQPSGDPWQIFRTHIEAGTKGLHAIAPGIRVDGIHLSPYRLHHLAGMPILSGRLRPDRLVDALFLEPIFETIFRDGPRFGHRHTKKFCQSFKRLINFAVSNQWRLSGRKFEGVILKLGPSVFH